MNPTYLSIFAICLTIIGLLFQHFAVLSGIKERITALETKMELFWKAIETNVSQLLKSYPTNIDKDILLDKLSNRELTLEDAQALRTVLIGEMECTKTNNKLAYILIIARVEQTIKELLNPEKKSIWKKFRL
jgi:ribosome biogenesis SPOUT family RNA methylase Rps3